MMPIMTEIVLIFSVLFLTGCVAVETRTAAPIDITQTTCRALYEEVDAAIDNAGVRHLEHGWPHAAEQEAPCRAS